MISTNEILVTGGNGMLAQALARALQARGCQASALRRADLDITDPDAIQRVLGWHCPSIIINCAAYTKVDQCETEPELAMAVNGAGPGHLAKWCAGHGAVLVHYSTDFVFDGNSTSPYHPDDPTGPLSMYGRSKLAGEQAIRSSQAQHLIVRTAWLYGRGGANFVRTMLDRAGTAQPVRVVHDQTGSPTLTDDLAEATLDLLERGARGTFHFTNAGQTTWFDFAAAIFQEFGVRADLSPLTSEQWRSLRPKSAVRPRYSVLDLSATQRLLGRPIRPWRGALRAFATSERTL
jgi:dTDP-4-dehydrorhamnose reductase